MNYVKDKTMVKWKKLKGGIEGLLQWEFSLCEKLKLGIWVVER